MILRRHILDEAIYFKARNKTFLAKLSDYHVRGSCAKKLKLNKQLKTEDLNYINTTVNKVFKV